jgi:hypothetical protein
MTILGMKINDYRGNPALEAGFFCLVLIEKKK